MIMFGSFLPSLGWLAPPKFTRAWEPTLLWNHYTNNLVFGELQRRWRTGIRRNYCFGSFFNTHACLRQLSASKCSDGPVLFILELLPYGPIQTQSTSRTASPLN